MNNFTNIYDFNQQNIHKNEQKYYYIQYIKHLLNLIKSIINSMINRVKDLRISIQLQRYLSGKISLIIPNLETKIINNNLSSNLALLSKPQMFYFCDQKRPPWKQQDLVGQSSKSFQYLNKKFYTLVQINKTINEKKLDVQVIKEMVRQIEQIIGSLISYVNNIKSEILNLQEKTIIMKLVYFLKSRNKIFSAEYSKLMINVLQLIKSPKLSNLLIKNFRSMTIKQKHFIINFLLIFQSNNKSQIRLLKKQVQASQIKDFSERYLAHDIILYLKQVYILRRLLKNQPIVLPLQFVNQCHQHIIKYIGTIQPKFAANYIRYRDARIKLEGSYFLKYVQEHIKKRKQVQNNNILDQVAHLMRILVQIPIQNPEDISPQMTKIRQIANQLIQVFNENYHKISKQNKDIHKLYIIRIPEINLLFSSLIKLSVIDYTFFGLLENMFFNGVYIARYEEIEKFIHNKVSFIKLIRGSMSLDNQQKNEQVILQKEQDQQGNQEGKVSSNLRKLKQDHKTFVEKLFDQIQKNSNLTLRQSFKLINLCQKIPFKSRKLKKVFEELIQNREKDKSLTEQQKALIQSMISLI